MEGHRHYYANYVLLLQGFFGKIVRVWGDETMLRKCQKNEQKINKSSNIEKWIVIPKILVRFM